MGRALVGRALVVPLWALVGPLGPVWELSAVSLGIRNVVMKRSPLCTNLYVKRWLQKSEWRARLSRLLAAGEEHLPFAAVVSRNQHIHVYIHITQTQKLKTKLHDSG